MCGKHVKVDKFMQICPKNYIHRCYRWLLSHYWCMNVQYILIYTCEHTHLLHFWPTLFFTQILQHVMRREKLFIGPDVWELRYTMHSYNGVHHIWLSFWVRIFMPLQLADFDCVSISEKQDHTLSLCCQVSYKFL